MTEVGCLKDGCFQNLQVEGLTQNPKPLGGIQIVGDTLATIESNASLVVFNADAGSSRVITMPPAEAGRKIKFIWEVEQGSSDRVFTRAGSDTFVGNIFTVQEGNAAGDGDAIPVAAGSQTITFLDDINIGSYVNLLCYTDGKWLVTGHIVSDAVPTTAGMIDVGI